MYIFFFCTWDVNIYINHKLDSVSSGYPANTETKFKKNYTEKGLIVPKYLSFEVQDISITHYLESWKYRLKVTNK